MRTKFKRAPANYQSVKINSKNKVLFQLKKKESR